jgi:hypothetical protein
MDELFRKSKVTLSVLLVVLFGYAYYHHRKAVTVERNARLTQLQQALNSCIESNDPDGHNPVGRKACRDMFNPEIFKLEAGQ